MENHTENLEKTIKFHVQKFCKENDLDDIEVMKKFKVKAEYQEKSSTFTAVLQCDLCSKQLIKSQNKNGLWMLTNFSRHTKNYYLCDESNKGKQSRKIRKGKSKKDQISNDKQSYIV